MVVGDGTESSHYMQYGIGANVNGCSRSVNGRVGEYNMIEKWKNSVTQDDDVIRISIKEQELILGLIWINGFVKLCDAQEIEDEIQFFCL